MTPNSGSASAEVSRARPFYAEYASLYDLLITDPVEAWVSAVHQRIVNSGLLSARVLDAGCGTGRHAEALERLGHQVTLVDASPALLEIASLRCPASRAVLADLCTLALPERFDVVTCRGVFNDLLADDERQSAVAAMTGHLRSGGILFCDLRETAAAQIRADGQPVTRTTAVPSGGSIQYTSTSTWSDGLIRVHEEHRYTVGSRTKRSEYDFAMRPWTRAEIWSRCEKAGLQEIQIGPGVGRRTPDRLFVVAVRP